MTLAAGTRLGPYEVLSPLGAGGMGEVYRARDTRLGREVAIKVLPAELAADRERLARFEQEARSASALNHPNIVTIYEIGREGDAPYMVMELVEGRTLREQLAEGPTPLRRLLAQASQMADALARAHEAGIVHRDLKPENVMVFRDGIKILDFGLAKLVPRNDSSSSQLATAIEPTRSGVVLGTVGYMSPEQASGHAIDFRSDQFSLGSILYEMAAGRRAFSRGTAAETMAAIIRDQPEPLDSLSPSVPSALRWIVERCLEKDPHDRYAATRDLARDLAHLRDHASELGREAAAGPTRRRGRRLFTAVAAALVVAALAAAAALLRARPEPAAAAVRFTVPIPPGAVYAPQPETSRGFSVSPDGTRLAIEATANGRRRIFLRPLDADAATELEGSTNASAHFWSPDGRSIAFFADGKLKRVPAAGGPAIELCDADLATVGAWGEDQTILFSRIDPPGIYRVPAAGGEAVRITTPTLANGPENHMWPVFLDARRFLYLINPRSGLARRELRVATLGSPEGTAVASLNSRVEYAPPGYLLYLRDSTLVAQPFDARTARLHGEPRELASSVHHHYGPAHAAFSVSRNGVVAYQTAAGPSRLVWVDRQGRESGSIGQASTIRGLRISPDGTRAAVDLGDPRTGTSDVWVFDLASGVSTRLHSDSADEIMPVWSPDGRRVVYRSDRNGPPDIYEMDVARPGSERPLLQLPGLEQPEDVSPDGSRLVYLTQVAASTWNIQLLSLDGGGRSEKWLPTRFNQVNPRFSPDGRWIAFESDESGSPEVYVALTRGAEEKRRISPSGGRSPRWSRDGKALYYVAADNLLMAVAVTPSEHWSGSAPAVVFRADTEIGNYDVTPDGARFLMSVPVEKTRESPLRVILNWPALLQREH